MILDRGDSIGYFRVKSIFSARLYWENKFGFVAPKNVSIPVAVSVFPDEIYTVSRSWAERAYPQLIYYNTCPVRT